MSFPFWRITLESLTLIS
jgi:hypothetical protein